MRATIFALFANSFLGLSSLLIWGCDRPPTEPPTASLQLYQNWQLQPGDQVNSYPVLSGLGDISLRLDGDTIYTPFRGTVYATEQDCILLISPDVPAYRFRLCGVQQPTLGEIEGGDRLGTADILTIALLRRQANGTWAMVEPSVTVVERWLPNSH